MQDWFQIDFQTIKTVLFSTVLIFTILLLLVRISGLRSFAKMTSIDFASTIAIGSLIASTVMSDSPSVLKGGMAIALVLLFQTLFAKLCLKFDAFEKIASNQPIFLMIGSEILYDNLHKSNLGEDDLMAKLREANVIQLSEVKAVVLETTGDVSVLHGEKNRKVDEIILKGVKKK